MAFARSWDRFEVLTQKKKRQSESRVLVNCKLRREKRNYHGRGCMIESAFGVRCRG